MCSKDLKDLFAAFKTQGFKWCSFVWIFLKSLIKVLKNIHQYQSKLEHLLVRSTFTSPAQGLDFGASRKSYSMVNIHHKSPSPRNSLTPFDVYTPTSHRPRSSLTIRGDRDRGPHGQGYTHYSFHWRRRSTSFLQKCNPRKYR